MLPNYYQFYCPVKILSGQLAVSNIPFEMKLLGCQKAMVVTDKGVVKAGLVDILKSAFADSDVKIGRVFDEVPRDSSDKVANRIAAIFKTEKCDCFIALGGGSALDSAKGANIVFSADSGTILDFQGADRITADLSPLIAIPTTAGTGSEVTRVAVIYNESTETKMSFVSDKLYPNLAVVDPRMTLTMPAGITAATGMDALTHAVEAYTCIQKNPIDDIFAKTALDLIRRYLVRATRDGGDLKARLGMANAALFAGIAFSNSMVGMVHALAHALGGVCHVPHGMANTILLPWCLEYNLDKVPEYIAELSGHLGGAGAYMAPREQAMETISLIRNLMKKLNRLSGLPLRLRDANVNEDKLPETAEVAVNDGALIYNPREVTYEDALGVYEKAF